MADQMKEVSITIGIRRYFRKIFTSQQKLKRRYLRVENIFFIHTISTQLS